MDSRQVTRRQARIIKGRLQPTLSKDNHMLHRVMSYALFSVVAISLFNVSVIEGDEVGAPAFWPQWRGPHRDDIATDIGLLPAWPSEGPPLLWTGAGLGAGYSSVAIGNGRIYTIGDRDNGEYLICLADANGKELWSTRIGDIWKDGGPRSTPTDLPPGRNQSLS
jgi:outer membrane protein assembly factor BamB